MSAQRLPKNGKPGVPRDILYTLPPRLCAAICAAATQLINEDRTAADGEE
jgi:hypothetical protein